MKILDVLTDITCKTNDHYNKSAVWINNPFINIR